MRIRIKEKSTAGKPYGIKKKRGTCPVAAVLTLCLLFFSVLPHLTVSAEESGDAAIEITDENAAAEESESGDAGSADAVLSAVQKRRTVFIGDSRTVGMYIAGTGGSATSQVLASDRNGDYWAARSGRGYNWAVSTGIPNAERYIGANTDVVFLIGVNDSYDLSYAGRTAALVSSKAAQYSALGARTFYVSVLPMRRNETAFTNEKINSWNAYMKENLSENVWYIDLATASAGVLSYSDDFHFQYETYRMLYQYLKIVTQYTAAAEGS